MKFHLPHRFFKALMAVVCVPGTTIAADAVQNTYTQPTIYMSSGVVYEGSSTFASTDVHASLNWDSTSGESAVWDADNTDSWVDENAEETSYSAGAQVEFGEGADLNKSVQIAPEGVTASTVEITGNGYQFNGGDMVVTERVCAKESAEIDSVLVIGSNSAPLEIEVAEGKKLTTSVIETSYTGTHEQHTYDVGSFEKTGDGTLTVTEAVHGSITGVTVTGGALELGYGVLLDVGANEIKGGTLENVEMVITGEIDRAVSGNVATAHNVITSADGINPAVLTNVALNAGTSTEYATLQNVAFAGASTLRGYITFEETQRQRDMSVAAGGTLTVDGVCFDLHGLASGEKVLIDNAAVNSSTGTLSGWDTATFVYSGITVNSAAIDTSVAGVVTIHHEHDGNLYWNGAEDAKWNPGSANWSTQPGSTDSGVFTALSNVYFGADAANHDITVAQDLVVLNLYLTGGDYSFSGGRIATLENVNINTGADKVTFRNQLVVQGNMTTTGKGTLELHGATTVVKDMALGSDHVIIDGDVSVLGNLTVNSGSDTTAGSLDIKGNVTAQSMNIVVSAGKVGGNAYNNALVNVTGNLTVGENGKISIGGTAEQHYLGVVTADNLTVNTQKHDVYFDHLHVNSLTVETGAHVHVQTSSAAVSLSSSSFPVINLYGTLSLDAQGTTYDQGYNVYVQDDAAALAFGTGCTIGKMKIYGKEDASGYTNLSIAARSHSATVEHMEKLGNLSVRIGSVTVKDATGAVHGTLTLDNGTLNLAEGANNLMANGSGAIVLANTSHLNIGSTSQTLSAGNTISLTATSTITGDAKGTGLAFADGASISYAGNDNAITANMVVDNTLAVKSELSGSSLNISGKLSGNGELQLSGAGTVAISGTNSFSGKVAVGQSSTLSLLDEMTLSQAGVILNNGGTLSLDTDTAVYLDTLTLNGGSKLSFSTITDTDDFSAKQAALHVTNGATGSGTLTISFAEKLDTLRTYNLLTGLTSVDGITLSILHNGVALAASQYKVGFDKESGLLYIHTLMGNVWEGKGGNSQKAIWSTSNKDGNWSDHSNYDETAEHKAAIFADLNGGTGTVYVQDEVAPEEVYFVADKTAYSISAIEDADGTGHLAAGTNIHKEGLADVTLQLSGNMDSSTALGDVDIEAGRLILGESLAVAGSVTIEETAKLELGVEDISGSEAPVELKMGPKADGSFNYMASASETGAVATLSGVTMDAAGISGEEEAYGSADKLQIQGNANLSYLTLTDFEAMGNVTLSHATLSSSNSERSHNLVDVTIGSGVEVDESGVYTLSGDITFEDTLLNKGKVTLTGITHVEIGQIDYSYTVAKSGKAEYVYQLVSKEGSGELTTQTFETEHVSINGVNLANGLADGMVADFKDNGNGSFTLSIGDITADGTSDGTVGMPQWDERWGKTANAPGISRRYFEKLDDGEVELAAGKDANTDYYKYGSIVKNATNVNNGKAIVATLSSVATGELIAGSRNEGNGILATDHEVWIEDRSAFKNIIGGLDDWLASWSGITQTAATHILVNSDAALDPDSAILNDPKNNRINDRNIWAKEFIFGGSRWCNQNAESFVTVQKGEIYTIFGASCAGMYLNEDPDAAWYEYCPSTQTGTSHVFIDGGRIGEIFGSGMHSTHIGTQVVNGRKRAVELVITDGILGGENLRVFGGGERGIVNGDIYVRVEGNAEIVSRLVGGSNAGEVYGNITMDLISGSAFRVDAAGLGWKHYDGTIEEAYIEGEILVNLYSDFKLGTGSDLGLKAGIYGGREMTNYVNENCTSSLHFAESATYNLGYLSDNGYTASDESIIVTGFDRFIMEEGSHAVLALGYFDIDMDPSRTLNISGQGVVEVIGHGANFGRNIELTNGATLKVSTSVIGRAEDDSDNRTIKVTNGTTLDLTGYPVASEYTASTPYAGLSFNTEICGDGVDGKGAIFKGTTHETADEKDLSVVNVSLPNVKLTGNASVGVMNHEVLHMNNYELGETTLDLGGHTFTKQGLGSFVARNVQMTEGTILIHQGDFYIDKGNLGAMTDVVMADGTSLYLNSTNPQVELTTTEEGDKHSLSIHTLNGAGHVILNDAELTLNTASDSAYRANYMDKAQSYNQFMDTTGFAHAVFSGTISNGTTGTGRLIKTGDGVHYISGSANTYSGGTSVQDGRLYLLGTSTSSDFAKGASAVASGVAGTGDIVWAGENAEIYLGHDARIYNNGTNIQDGVLTIGVEGVPNGVLADFDKESTPVMKGDVEYVEIETHNLKSLTVNAEYADGTTYVAGTDIDRNKMLLVKKSDWDSVKDSAITGLSDTGYNEAIYSGVLYESNNVVSCLHKVGVGTLVLDQANSYTGGTEIEGGTLRLRGWGSLGKNEKANAVNVQDGATLMFTHNSGYGNEPTSVANDITISGSGDARWVGQAATDGDTAALISAVGPAVTFAISGNISGDGNVRHSGEGVLVLNGDSTYTGGTYASRGTVEVQSATGLGNTASGLGSVTIENDAALRVTVEEDYTGDSMVTTLAADVNDIQGHVSITGTVDTKRILHMDGNGYNALSTTLNENGTLLLNGAAINSQAVEAESELLTGNGKVVVSDASGAGASATFESMIDYNGDFHVEGDNASINVKAGTFFMEGNIHVAGKQATVSTGSDIFITDGHSLSLNSTGNTAQNTAAVVKTDGAVSIESGATFYVKNQETVYNYDLSELQNSVSFAMEETALATVLSDDLLEISAYHNVGPVGVTYEGRFDATNAVNNQAVATVQAKGGLTLAGGSTYDTSSGHANLMGGSLTLDTTPNSLLTFNTAPDVSFDAFTGEAQLVLFSGVNSVYFGTDQIGTEDGSGIYYTLANRYLTGCDYVDENTLLVYDATAKVLYLQQAAAVPEPTTATLSLLALAALAARRRRK